MKKYSGFIFLFLIVILSANLSAQKALLKKANKLYNLKAYADAVPYYEHALKKDSTLSDALVNLADCYRLTNNSHKSMEYYAKVVKLPTAPPINIYYYAQALMQNGKYDAAKDYMSEYKGDERGKVFKDAITQLSIFYKDTAYFHIKLACFNSKQNDFSPVILNDGRIVFVSARNRTQLISYTHSWTDRKYYALYQTEKDDEGNYIKPKTYARNIQIRFNDGPICFDKDGKTVYITRNNIKKCKVIRNSKGDVVLNMYAAVLDVKKKRFVNLKGFEFNSDEYNTAHPAISPDGKRLYFVSNMPGTMGGMDLWICYKQDNGWGKPENLGDKVNTAGDEVFPYVLDNNTLYFSSNGYKGIGGLDIFSVKLDDKGMPLESPKNMGVPMNSSADDFGIAFNSDGKSGFFSSNRATSDLDDDIYEFRITLPEQKPYEFLVKDSATKQLLDAGIVITDNKTGERKELSNKNGQFTVDLLPEHSFTISANSTGYVPRANIQYTSPADNQQPYEILLPKVIIFVPKYFIAGTVFEVFDDSTKKPLDSARIVISEEGGNNVCSTYITDASGKYHSCDLKANTSYTVTAMKDGYFTKSSTVPSIPPGGAIRNFYLSKIVIGKAIKIENIYFDLDKSNIRPDAAVELDKIVKLLNENPDIIIELSSHTDCRASAAYNMALSDRRAKSSAAYIVSKGIDSKRITGKGYGESMLVNRCACEGNVKSDCTEEEHQQNRRTEFKVTGFVKGMGKVDMKSGK